MAKVFFSPEGSNSDKPSFENEKPVEVFAQRIDVISDDIYAEMKQFYGEERAEKILATITAERDPERVEKLRLETLTNMYGAGLIKRFRGAIYRLYPVIQTGESLDPRTKNTEERAKLISDFRYRLLVNPSDNYKVLNLLNPDAAAEPVSRNDIDPAGQSHPDLPEAEDADGNVLS